MLVPVRELDDRLRLEAVHVQTVRAEWLAWRSSISLSAGREQRDLRTRLRLLPAIARDSPRAVVVFRKCARRHASRTRRRVPASRVLRSMRRRHKSRNGVDRLGMFQPDSARACTARMGAVNPDAVARRGRGTLRLDRRAADRGRRPLVRAPDCAVAEGEVTPDVDPDAVCRIERHGVVRATGRCARRRGEVVARWRRCRGRGDGGSLPGRRLRGREIPHGEGLDASDPRIDDDQTSAPAIVAS